MVTTAAPHTDLAPDRIGETYAAASELPDAPEEFERQLRRAYQAVLKPGDVAVDVGAYSGKHTIPLAFAVGEAGMVYAAEPNPSIVPVLRRRIAGAAQLGLHVELFEGCVQDDPDAETRLFSVIPAHPGWSALTPRDVAPEATVIEAPSTTLDRLVPAERVQDVAFVKIDVEGAELAVLAGGHAVLEALPVHHIELSYDGAVAHGYRIEDFVDFYADDYVVLDMLGFTFADRDAMRESFAAAGVFDYVAIPRRHPRFPEVWAAVRTALLRGFPDLEVAVPPAPPASPSRYGPVVTPGRRLRSALPSVFPRGTAVAGVQPPPLPTAIVARDGAASSFSGPPPHVAVTPAGPLVTLGHGREFTATVAEGAAVSIRLAALVDVYSAIWGHQTLLALTTPGGVEVVLRYFKPYEAPNVIVELMRLEGDKLRIASTGEVDLLAGHLTADVRITRRGVVARVAVGSSFTMDLKAGYKPAGPTISGKIGERLPPAEPDGFRGAALLATAVAGGAKRPTRPAPWNVRAARRGLRWVVVGSARRARQVARRVASR